MAFRKNLKKELRALLGEGDVAQLVNDQKTVGGILLYHPAQALVVPSLDQLIGQGAARDKSGPPSLPTGLHPKGGGQVGQCPRKQRSFGPCLPEGYYIL